MLLYIKQKDKKDPLVEHSTSVLKKLFEFFDNTLIVISDFLTQTKEQGTQQTINEKKKYHQSNKFKQTIKITTTTRTANGSPRSIGSMP